MLRMSRVTSIALGGALVAFGAAGAGAADPHVFIYDGATLYVSDAATLALVTKIAGAIDTSGDGPGFDDGRHMVVDSLGERIFVSNHDSDFDVYDFTLTQCANPFDEVGTDLDEPLGIFPLPSGQLLLTDEDDEVLLRLNADLTVDAQSGYGGLDTPEGVVFSGVHNRIYVADEDDDEIEIFNGSTLDNTATESFPCGGEGVFSLAIAASSNRLFALSEDDCPGNDPNDPGANNFGIHVFDIESFGDVLSFDQTIFGSGGGGSDCYGAITVSEDANRLFAIDFCSDTVDIYNTTNLNFVGSVPTARAGDTPLLVSVGELNVIANALETAPLESSGTLIMPFDQTANHVSFQTVTRPSTRSGSGPIATHWSYWSDDCRHLVDVVVCLTPADTKVMDPAAVQSEVQQPNPPANTQVGSVTDLTGERGLVTVTAFEASTGPSGLECNIIDREATVQGEIFGGWVIADTATSAAFGADAVGLASDALPNPGILDDGLDILSFNPQGLGDSEVIVVGLELSDRSGNGFFRGSEIGPIARALPAGPRVCCNVTFTDNLEITTSLPDLCFECVGFNPMSDLQADVGAVSVIPPNTTIDSPGFAQLANCVSADEEGLRVPLGDAFDQFLFAWHGQAIGPFGAAFHGKYPGAAAGGAGAATTFRCPAPIMRPAGS